MSGFYVHNEADQTYWSYFLTENPDGDQFEPRVARILCHEDEHGTFVTGIAQETSGLHVAKAVADCSGEIIGDSRVIREKWLSRRNIIHCYPDEERMTIERSPLSRRRR